MPRQMQENGTAATGDARRGIVVNLDDVIVQMIVTGESVASLILREPQRPVIMPARGIFAPGVVGPDGANRQHCSRPRMPVGAPPEPLRVESAQRGTTVAFPFVGPG